MDDLFGLFGSDDDMDAPEFLGGRGHLELGEEEELNGVNHLSGSSSNRPAKRSRVGGVEAARAFMEREGRVGAGAGGSPEGGSSNGSGTIDEHEEQEVIEILSDEEDSHNHPLPRSSSRTNNRSRQVGNRSAGSAAVAAAAAAAMAAAAAPRPGAAGRRSGRHEGSSGDDHQSPAAPGGTPEPRKLGAGGAGSTSSHGPAPSGVVPPPWKTGGAELEEGKPSAEEKAGAGAGGSGWLEGLVAAAKAATSKLSPCDDPDAQAKGAAAAAGGQIASSGEDLPLNLECAVCFNPLAVTALFACGHGSCWECAHDWCSRVRVRACVFPPFATDPRGRTA